MKGTQDHVDRSGEYISPNIVWN